MTSATFITLSVAIFPPLIFGTRIVAIAKWEAEANFDGDFLTKIY